MSDSKIYTRREFLRLSAVASATAMMPAFLVQTAHMALGQETNPSPAPAKAPIPGFKDDRILVVVQLGGGNDGLNTVVPFADDVYYRNRQVIGIPKERVLKMTDYWGFNDKLAPLKKLHDDGKLATILGVGYPNPNRSHFRSFEIWHTASDSDRYETDGWIGRYFDNCCEGTPEATCGVQIGQDLVQAFDGKTGRGVSFQDPNAFRWNPGFGRDTDEAFRAVNKTATTPADPKNNLDFLRHVTANISLSSDRVIKSAKTSRAVPQYPQARFSRDFSTVATLIAANMPTRIYYIAFSGFDTHANQANTQDGLLAGFAGCVETFFKDLTATGHADRVTIMCFSEFGRRVEENASRGTDHGTAGPMFFIGNSIKAGIHGKYPSLTDLDGNKDLKYNVDFRTVYAAVLEDWFAIDHSKVLRKKFEKFPLFK